MRLADQWQQPSSSSSVFDALGQEWTIVPPDQQAQGLAPSTPPAKTETQTPTRKRKSVDQMAGNASQKSQHNTHAHNAHQAREILQSQAQAQLQELQAKAQAEALAQAQALPAPQSHPVAQCATPESGDVYASLKEVLVTALKGNEELMEIVGQHESVAKEAAKKIDEIVMKETPTSPSLEISPSTFLRCGRSTRA